MTGDASPGSEHSTNGSGPALSWREYDAYGRERYRPQDLHIDSHVGVYYHVQQYYYSGYDGTEFYDDATDYCLVA